MEGFSPWEVKFRFFESLFAGPVVNPVRVILSRAGFGVFRCCPVQATWQKENSRTDNNMTSELFLSAGRSIGTVTLDFTNTSPSTLWPPAAIFSLLHPCLLPPFSCFPMLAHCGCFSLCFFKPVGGVNVPRILVAFSYSVYNFFSASLF